MTLRYLAVVALLSAVGAGLLGLRRQQLNDRHAIAASHTQMKADRERIKDLQVRIAKRATPEALLEAIDRNRLQLEPIALPPQSDAPEMTPEGPPEPDHGTTRATRPPEPRDG